ncbi:MAG: L28 family ribosomal protein [Patescibacteria group bacterium]
MAHPTSCEICGKGPVIGFNRPKSLHKTKRIVRPNIQRWNKLDICSRCRRTLVKTGAKTLA